MKRTKNMKTKAYGEVKHGRKRPAAWRAKHGSSARTVGLTARVFRERDGSYAAITCPVGKGDRADALIREHHSFLTGRPGYLDKRRRCALGYGSSPTKALKRSLAALVKKL